MAIPIILDCDPGHDDAIALLLALASPEVELLGVTTVHGNQTLDKTTENALRVLELVGRTDIPVSRGADQPLLRELQVAAHVHGESGLDGPALPEATAKPVDAAAIDFIAGRIRPGTVLVAVGPLTNIALYLEAHGTENVERIVLMGGAIAEGNMTPAAEFNIWADPEAAHRVFHCGRPVTMIGLDVTHQALLDARLGGALSRRRPDRHLRRGVGRVLQALPRAHLRLGRRPDPRRAGAGVCSPTGARPHGASQRRDRGHVGALPWSNGRRPVAAHGASGKRGCRSDGRRRRVSRAAARADRAARLMPPGLIRIGVAAIGSAAVALGLVALLNGRLVGIAIAVGGAVLVLWSVYGHRLRP